MSGALATLRVDTDRMRQAASDPLLLATDLAETLVREGVPFRDAHEAVGKLVAHCVREGLDLRDLSREQLQEWHAAFPAAGSELLDLEGSVEARNAAGGTSRARVEAALATLEEELDREAEALGGEAS